MDNVTSLPPPPNPSVIKLDQFQYALYEQSSLKIHSPNDQYLETIGQDIQRENRRDANTQLFHQICLVRSLSSHIDQHLELPPHAVYGLTDLLFQVEEFCESQIK